jgi:hypothetical protein
MTMTRARGLMTLTTPLILRKQEYPAYYGIIQNCQAVYDLISGDRFLIAISKIEGKIANSLLINLHIQG